VTLTKPCAQCPWRLANQGKRHPGSFYTKANLRRLWGQVRRGGSPQSCHLTDPRHPDHVAAGAKPDATPLECPGSIILIGREFLKIAEGGDTMDVAGVERYLARRRFGLTRSGVRYWVIQRLHLGQVPLLGGPPIPDVDDDPAIGLPPELAER
jgi:hypothetical protein